jgi:hypothetical protein
MQIEQVIFSSKKEPKANFHALGVNSPSCAFLQVTRAVLTGTASPQQNTGAVVFHLLCREENKKSG